MNVVIKYLKNSKEYQSEEYIISKNLYMNYLS